LDSKNDSDIKVETYGVSVPATQPDGELFSVDTGGGCLSSLTGGCITSIIGKFMDQKKMEPLLQPGTVKDFFSTKKDFPRIIRERSKSIPVELYLKPWSQYLVAKGIIRIDQTVPVSLFDNKKWEITDGMVSIKYSDGSIYIGTLSNGLKTGKGVLKTGGGSEYKGDWKYDLMHGKGVYTHKDGSSYSGDFLYGYPHGKGENRGKSGNVYSGTIYKSRLTGQGTMQYKDGRIYKGEVKDGEPDGRGVMEFPDGKKTDGIFKKGIFLDK